MPGVDPTFLNVAHKPLSWALIPAFILSSSGLLLFTFRITWIGYLMVAALSVTGLHATADR